MKSFLLILICCVSVGLWFVGIWAAANAIKDKITVSFE